MDMALQCVSLTMLTYLSQFTYKVPSTTETDALPSTYINKQQRFDWSDDDP